MMDEDVNFYVSDMGNARIAVFDQSGNFSHKIGGKGQGPGEFRSVLLQSVNNGQVIILDSILRRISVMTYEGDFVRHISIGEERIDVESRLYVGPESTSILTSRFIHNEHRPKIISSWRATVLSESGEQLLQIETDPVYEMTMAQSVEASTGGYFLGHPYAGYYHGKGIVISTGTEPEFRWFTLDGSINQIIRLDIPSEPVTQDERSTVMDRLDQKIENAQHPRLVATYSEQRKIAEFPDNKGFWCEFGVDDSGFIWAQKTHAYYLDEYPERSTFLIISPEGEYLGDTVLPTVWGTISRGHFLANHSDEETGLPLLKVFKIQSAVRGFDYE